MFRFRKQESAGTAIFLFGKYFAMHDFKHISPSTPSVDAGRAKNMKDQRNYKDTSKKPDGDAHPFIKILK